MYCDETRLRVEGKSHWLHCASTADLACYTVHPNSGRKAMEAQDILPHDAPSPLGDSGAPG